MALLEFATPREIFGRRHWVNARPSIRTTIPPRLLPADRSGVDQQRGDVCGLGGWDRGPLFFLVRVERTSPDQPVAGPVPPRRPEPWDPTNPTTAAPPFLAPCHPLGRSELRQGFPRTRLAASEDTAMAGESGSSRSGAATMSHRLRSAPVSSLGAAAGDGAGSALGGGAGPATGGLRGGSLDPDEEEEGASVPAAEPATRRAAGPLHCDLPAEDEAGSSS
jgi:hypothetical protein